MQPIFLIGYMGSGKSTLGRHVCALTGKSFIDLDLYIEERLHATVSQIFATRGEQGFRDMERRMLHEVGEMEDVVVACGGGTPCFYDNMEWMTAHGTTVYLHTSLDKLFTRLKRGKHKRPLLADKTDDELRQHIEGALAARMPYYSQAECTFVTDLMDCEEDKRVTAQRFVDQFDIQ